MIEITDEMIEAAFPATAVNCGEEPCKPTCANCVCREEVEDVLKLALPLINAQVAAREAELLARVKVLEDALRPFAHARIIYQGNETPAITQITAAQVRAARVTLESKP